MTLKVALFMHDFAGDGVERMRLSLASALTDAACHVSIVVVNAAGPLTDKIPAGVRLVDLNCRRLIYAIPKLRRYLQNEKPDFLVSSLCHNNIAALCARAITRTDVRLIICQHNALSQEIGLGWKYRAIPLLYRVLAPRANGIVAVSHGVADDLAVTASISRNTITVIGNPVIRSVHPRQLPLPAHPWMNDRSIPVFVFAGRLVTQKNPMMLISAFVQHVATHRARLVVLGDGPLRGAMRQVVVRAGLDQDVHFAGFVPEPLHWIGHAHALLLTSDYEGFANVLVEALACGTPVIATNCPFGPSEILVGGQYGHLVPLNDAAAMARAMADDLRARFPAAGLRARAQDFTAQKAAADHIALFRRCVERPHKTIFGLALTAETAHDIAEQVLNENPTRTKLVVTPNIDHVRLLHAQPPFRAACLSADTVCADGWPVAFYAALRGVAPRRRATGCDILHAVVGHNQVTTRRILAVVESRETSEALARWLFERRWTNWAIEVAPRELASDAAAQVLLAARIRAAQPHILIMTLGAPTSETFVHQNTHVLPHCWAICVGQALRVEIGLTSRAPLCWRRAGLEWAWRCAHEPARLGPRYLRALLWFPFAATADVLRSVRPSARTPARQPTSAERHT